MVLQILEQRLPMVHCGIAGSLDHVLCYVGFIWVPTMTLGTRYLWTAAFFLAAFLYIVTTQIKTNSNICPQFS